MGHRADGPPLLLATAARAEGLGRRDLDGPPHAPGYAALCGSVLARAHARTGDPMPIAAYLCGKDSFDRAIAVIADRYAEQSLIDHAALRSALTARRLPSVPPGP
ncbi:DUF2252 family protein [Streptomyces sp. NRRL S-448]